MSVIVPSTRASAGAPSRLTNPAIPHIYGAGRVSAALVGMAAFIIAESAIFTIFVVAYLFYVGKSLTGPTPRDVLEVPIFYTICLLSSSATIHLAGRRLERNKSSSFLVYWLITIALGATFMFGTAQEWRRLIYEHGLTISTNLFGTTYYSLVGLHAFHVTVGLMMLFLVAIFGLVGRVGVRADTHAPDGVGLGHQRLEGLPDRVLPRGLVAGARLLQHGLLERQLADAKRELALGGGGGGDTAGAVRELGGVKLLARIVQNVAAKDLRGLVDDAKRQLGSGIVVIISVGEEGKASLVVGVTDDLTGANSAVDLVRVGAEALGGKGGGGRPDFAQAGGPDGAKADAAIAAIEVRLGEAPGDNKPLRAGRA